MPFRDMHEQVTGINLLAFLRWAQASFEWRDGQRPPDCGVLALPPIQRNAAWNPRQVVDVWDSVFRGLPLGAFMLQERNEGQPGRRSGADACIDNFLPQGWDLLDGQQRVRSLLLGLYGPNLRRGRQDKRCIWLDLYGKSDRYLFELSVTSASQPFGYNEDGYKFAPATKAQARKRFEDEGEEIRNGDRQAYSHELFEGFMGDGPTLLRLVGDEHEAPVPPLGYPKGWPPLPARIDLGRLANARTIFPLHELLQVWVEAESSKDEALLRFVGRTHPRFPDLVDALKHFEEAVIALVNASSVRGKSLPLLYDRIGAGGTRLSDEERLFSFYKSIRPRFHDVVRGIYEACGRMMAPSQIAASAIRIANAQAHYERDRDSGGAPRANEGNSLPNIATFAEALENTIAPGSRIRLLECLDGLIGIAEDGSHTEGSFGLAFARLFRSLEFSESNLLGLPRVLLWNLPRTLIHVLLFWLLHTEQVFDEENNHLPRFVMFWLLCSRDDEKASSLCFRLIRETERVPLKALYDALRGESSVSRGLIPPSLMNQTLTDGSVRGWRDINERIGQQDPLIAEFVTRWWWDGGNILPWLQRAYLNEAFPGYDPTADREDDTPYDVDHMIPRNDWRFDWRERDTRLQPTNRFSKEELNKLRWLRDDIGESIGNKWLVDFSTNRGWGDAGCAEKLQQISGPNGGVLRKLLDVFPHGAEARSVWDEASPSNWRDVPWSDERMRKFQQAVERRAAWLYERIYSDLKFSAWVPDPI